MAEWLKDSIFYEIYPQSFNDTNGDGIGDFQGIIEKLDYIKSLGFNALWLNPCFKSPFLDAGYDVSDYCETAPRYGTNDDLVRLFGEAHKRGMHVLLDLVPGHTSWEHPWFKESCKPEENEFSGRYIWSSSMYVDVAGFPGITGSIRGMYDREGSVATNFFTHQPSLNYGFANPTEPWMSAVDSPEALATRQAIKDVMVFWLSRGCDGFRVDMAGSLVKNDEGQKETIKLWSEMIGSIKEDYPESAFVSEWGEPDKSIAGGYDMDFLLHFGPSHYMDLFRTDKPYFGGEGDISQFVKTYKSYMKATDGKGLICIPSGNHDMDRMAKYLNDTQMKLAYAFLMSMPGAPFVYYGDEIGMRQLDLVSKEGGYKRTGARTPMQWTSGKNYGFSDAEKEQLYVEQDMSADAPTVEAAESDEGSVLNELKRIIEVRKEHPALGAEGSIEFVYAEENAYPFCYLRSGEGEKILVCLNPSKSEAQCRVPYKCIKTAYTLGGETVLTDSTIKIPPESAAFIEVE